MRYNPQARIRFISVVVVVLALFFGVRLFFLQIVRGEEYNLAADRQYLNSASTFFDRGSIYFTKSDGSPVPAATLKQEFNISANPRLVLNAEAVYDQLSQLIELDHSEFVERMADKSSAYEPLASGLNLETAEKIKELNLRGIFIQKEKKRFYPAGDTASHVLGLMAYGAGDKYSGQYGLEKHYDHILTRQDSGSFANFFAEIFLGLGKTVLQQEGGEADIVLTIDPVVQGYLEDEIAKTAERWGTDRIGAIVMNPRTGEILAMAAMPNFDPGVGVKDISVLPNPLTERVYEMGSVVKPLTVAAGLDAGVITPSTTYFDSGCLTLNSRKICNYDGKARGTVDMQEVLNQSLNTGVTFISQKLGHDKFRDYMLSFGLGERTGIDLPNEATGLVNNLNSNRAIEHATASFGQGIAVTPIEMIRAFAVLANGGYLVTPHVVQEIQYDDGVDKVTEIKKGPQVISSQASASITNMLIKTVDDALAGGAYSMERYSIAAKTGTAQIPDQVNGGYYDDRYLHSFFGYFPAREPQFVVFMYIIHPKGVRYASETLTEPFMNNAKFLLNYYEVPPDR